MWKNAAAVVLFTLISGASWADAPPAPVKFHHDSYVTTDTGIWADEIRGNAWGVVGNKGGLDLHRIDGKVHTWWQIAQPRDEVHGSASISDELVVFLSHGPDVQGPNDVLLFDDRSRSTRNISSSSDKKSNVSIFNGIAAWETGGNIYMNEVHRGTPPKKIGSHWAKRDPDVGYRAIAYGAGLGLEVFDLWSKKTHHLYSSLGGPTGGLSHRPSIGWTVVAYNVNLHTIGYRYLYDLDEEYEILGPCSMHTEPRVNRMGTLVVHAGIGCPSGTDGIFVTHLLPDNSQEIYRVADLPSNLPYGYRNAYSIINHSMAYVSMSSKWGKETIQYIEFAF